MKLTRIRLVAGSVPRTGGDGGGGERGGFKGGRIQVVLRSRVTRKKMESLNHLSPGGFLGMGVCMGADECRDGLGCV